MAANAPKLKPSASTANVFVGLSWSQFSCLSATKNFFFLHKLIHFVSFHGDFQQLFYPLSLSLYIINFHTWMDL